MRASAQASGERSSLPGPQAFGGQNLRVTGDYDAQAHDMTLMAGASVFVGLNLLLLRLAINRSDHQVVGVSGCFVPIFIIWILDTAARPWSGLLIFDKLTGRLGYSLPPLC
jgi:hypothetical protein